MNLTWDNVQLSLHRNIYTKYQHQIHHSSSDFPQPGKQDAEENWSC